MKFKINKVNLIALMTFIILVQITGIIGGIFTAKSVSTWYVSLNKPSFQPPNWIFGPVWVFLYFLIGISGFLVWSMRRKQGKNQSPLVIFIFQLILNGLWSFLFFALRNPFVAFIDICFLWITIVVMIIIFYRVSRISAFLMFPYILWVTFAAILNYSLWQLN